MKLQNRIELLLKLSDYLQNIAKSFNLLKKEPIMKTAGLFRNLLIWPYIIL